VHDALGAARGGVVLVNERIVEGHALVGRAPLGLRQAGHRLINVIEPLRNDCTTLPTLLETLRDTGPSSTSRTASTTS
jgi:hypothetical protein